MGCAPSNDNGTTNNQNDTTANDGGANSQSSGDQPRENPLQSSATCARENQQQTDTGGGSSTKVPGGEDSANSAKSSPKQQNAGILSPKPEPGSPNQGNGHQRGHSPDRKQSPNGKKEALTISTPDAKGHSTSNSNTTVGSSQAPPTPVNPAVMLPTHVLQDSTGRRVTSCISSRTKLAIVTRWIDSAMRYREKLPERRWPNPQDDYGRERADRSQSPQNTSVSQVGGNTPSHLGESLNPSAMNASASQMSFLSTRDSTKPQYSVLPQIPTGSTNTGQNPLSPGYDSGNMQYPPVVVNSTNTPLSPGALQYPPVIPPVVINTTADDTTPQVDVPEQN